MGDIPESQQQKASGALSAGGTTGFGGSGYYQAYPQGHSQGGKGIADIVFLIDATGGMKPCIDAVKNSVRMFIGELTGGANNQAPVKEWRAKVVAYRDYIYDSEPLVDHDFTDDPAVLEGQMASLQADGGGDEPESLLEGIYHVATMEQTEKGVPLSPNKWRYRNGGARMVMIFTDASYHDVMEDMPSRPTKGKGGGLDDVVNVCHSNRIMLQVFAPAMDCHYELGEINKAEVHTFVYDETKEDGAAKGLEEFISEKTNFQQALRALADWRPPDPGGPLL